MLKRTLAAVLFSVPFALSAATYSSLDSEQSNIQFHYEQIGVKMDGTFSGIEGDIHFDTTDASNAKVKLQVKMDSVNTGSEEADSEVVKPEWFNAEAHPDALFTVTSIESKSTNEFEVTGLLSIKGHEQEIRFPATVIEAENKATFTGSFSLLRGDYAIGEGVWSTFDMVANDVRVDFTIVATE